MRPTFLELPVGAEHGASAVRRASTALAADGYTMQTISDATSTGLKRVTPRWAVVLAVVFTPAALLGLCFLLVKQQRQVKIEFTPGGSGGVLLITGVISGKTAERLRSEFRAPDNRHSPAVSSAHRALALNSSGRYFIGFLG